MLFRHGAQNRQADGMISSHAGATHTSSKQRSNSLLDSAKSVLDGKRIHREIPEVRHAILGKGIHVHRWIPRPDYRGLHANVARAEARPRAIGRATIEWHADQRNLQFFRLCDVRQTHKRGYARETGVFERVNRLGMRQLKLPAGWSHGRAS